MPAPLKRAYRPRRRTVASYPYRRRLMPMYRAPRAAPRRRAASSVSRSYQMNTDAIRVPPTTAPTSNWGSTIGGGIGSLFGPAGSALGSLLGHGAQSLVKLVTGFGDYNVQRNSLLPGALEPPIVMNKSRGIIVRHREYIADIIPSVAFSTNTYSINAGLVETFPWLSQIGQSFEEYCIHGMLFEFKSMSSDAVLSSSANSSLGTVIMATQYNSLNPGFADKREMENYEFANSAKPSESFIHPIECKGSETPVKCLYVRTGAVPSGADQRLYDLGDFTIATQGMQSATGVVGELWVTFEIEFYKPKLLSGLGLELLMDHYVIPVATVTNSRPFGTSRITPSLSSTLGSQLLANLAPAIIAFPPYVTDGTFIIEYSITGTSATLNPPVVTAVSNCALGTTLFSNNTTGSVYTPAGTVGTVYMYVGTIIVSGPSATFSFGTGGTLPSSPTSGDFIITQINASVS